MDEVERICRLIEGENGHFRIVKPLVKKIREQDRAIESLVEENERLQNELGKQEARRGIGLCLPIDYLEG